MSSNLVRDLPSPPLYFSEQEIQIWRSTGKKLIEKKVLRKGNLNYFYDLIFWKFRKKIIEENLAGNYSKHQYSLMGNTPLKLTTQGLLLNYKAVQDELNELRKEFGLESQSPQYISNTPLIPDEVYQNLPEGLKKCCQKIHDFRSKDTFLLYSLPVLASHLTGIFFEHADGIFNPSLKNIILNPSGILSRTAGKAVGFSMVLSEKLLERNAGFVFPQSYVQTDLKAFITKLIANKGNVLILDESANLQSLNELPESSIFCDIVEHSFKEKPLRLTLSNDNYHIIRPAANISLCASIDDIKKLSLLFGEQHLTNYLFYIYDQQTVWESARPGADSQDLSEEIHKLSAQVSVLHEICSNRNFNMEIKLQNSHWQMIDETFMEKTALIDEAGFNQSLNKMVRNSSVYTLKLISVFRLLRSIEQKEDIRTLHDIFAKDEDVIAALWLVDTLMKHAFRIYQNLPIMQKEDRKGDRYHRFYNVLPIIFNTAEAIEIASRVSIPKRTANRYLTNYLKENILKKLRKGVYYKQS